MPSPRAFYVVLEVKMKTAILIDGAFFIKRVRSLRLSQDFYDAKRMADLVVRYSLLHLKHKINGKEQVDDLYRIFFYDCVPFEKKMHNPISNKAVDFSKTPEAQFRHNLHAELKQKRKLALRLGKLSDNTSWILKPQKMKEFLKNPSLPITEDDVMLDVKQKGVDMRIGLDISSISLKKQVDKIILFSGDSDFVPAAKLARREGIDFILDPMWNHIPLDLMEHIDGLKTKCPNPKNGRRADTCIR